MSEDVICLQTFDVKHQRNFFVSLAWQTRWINSRKWLQTMSETFQRDAHRKERENVFRAKSGVRAFIRDYNKYALPGVRSSFYLLIKCQIRTKGDWRFETGLRRNPMNFRFRDLDRAKATVYAGFKEPNVSFRAREMHTRVKFFEAA